MEKNVESQAKFVRRRLAQVKVLTRLLEHELELAKGEEVILDKELLENVLDLLEIFVEDTESVGSGGARERKTVAAGEGKPQVTRLN